MIVIFYFCQDSHLANKKRAGMRTKGISHSKEFSPSNCIVLQEMFTLKKTIHVEEERA